MHHAFSDVLSSAYKSLGLVPVNQSGDDACYGTAWSKEHNGRNGHDIHAASAWVRCLPADSHQVAPRPALLAPSVDVPHPESAVNALLQDGWQIAQADDIEARCVHSGAGLAITLRQSAASHAYVSEGFLQAPGQSAQAQAQLAAVGMHVLFHSHNLCLPSGTSRVPCVHMGCSTAPHAPSVTLVLGEEVAVAPCSIHMQDTHIGTDTDLASDLKQASSGPLQVLAAAPDATGAV